MVAAELGLLRQRCDNVFTDPGNWTRSGSLKISSDKRGMELKVLKIRKDKGDERRLGEVDSGRSEQSEATHG